MTQTSARPIAPEDLGDPEPIGLASSWTDGPPARRALPVEDGPHFQATPVRVDEPFPEYEAYHSVIEFPAFDAVAAAAVVPRSEGWGEVPVVGLPLMPRAAEYGWVPGSPGPQHLPPVAPGLAPYPMALPPQLPMDPYANPAPIVSAYALAAAPNPYQSMNPQPMSPMLSNGLSPMTPAPYGLTYPMAAPTSAYGTAVEADDALMAVGGSVMVIRKVAMILPAVVVAATFTWAATMFGGLTWVMAVFAWLTAGMAIIGRRGKRSISRPFGRL